MGDGWEPLVGRRNMDAPSQYVVVAASPPSSHSEPPDRTQIKNFDTWGESPLLQANRVDVGRKNGRQRQVAGR